MQREIPSGDKDKDTLIKYLISQVEKLENENKHLKAKCNVSNKILPTRPINKVVSKPKLVESRVIHDFTDKKANEKTYTLNKQINYVDCDTNRENINAMMNNKNIINMEQNDLVSVIILSHNDSDSLKRALDSVKNQTYKNIEIIVVNENKLNVNDNIVVDGMTVINIDLGDNKNIKNTMINTGVKASKGLWFCLMNYDDYWIPEKLQIQLYYSVKHNAFASITNYIKGNGYYDSENMKSYYVGIKMEKSLYRYENKIFAIGQSKAAYIMPSTLMINKEFYDTLDVNGENDFCRYLISKTKMVLVDLMLTYYNIL